MATEIIKDNAITQLNTLISGLDVSTATTEQLTGILKIANMASVDSSAIKTELTSRIQAVTSSTTIYELGVLAAALPLITNNRVLSVTDLSSLTSLSAEPGAIYFVESENIPYVLRSDATWAKLFPLFQGTRPVVRLWAWGNNTSGRLGDGTTVSKSSPVSVVGGYSDWVQVSVSNFGLGVRANGTLWSWGFNSEGSLGDGTTVSKSSPVSVLGGFTDWIQASAGAGQGLGLRANGTLWSWGSNSFGKLGDDTVGNKSSPVSVVGGFTDWVQVSAGDDHVVALRANGTAWSWGYNLYGRLGDGTTVHKSSPVSVVGGFTDWVQVSAGGGNSGGLRSNGTIWTWGSNSGGQLGDNTTTSRSSPVSVVGGFVDWVQVSISSTSFGIRSNGSLWSWGSNFSGQLGDNSTTNKSSPVSVVGGFTDWTDVSTGAGVLAIRANGTLWAWGGNTSGQLGDNTTTSRSSPVSVVGGFTDWVQVDAGTLQSAGIRMS